MRITGVGGGVTVSSNTGQRIDISVAAPVAQTGTQFSAGISGGNTSNHSGTVAGRVVFAGGNNITLSGSTAGASESITISAASQTVQTQNLHNVTLSRATPQARSPRSRSGTMTLAGGNNITLSQAGNAVTISGPNVAGAQTGISSIAASNTTYTSGQVEFTGSGIVTIRSSAGQRVVVDASQSVQTQGQFSAGISNLGNTAGDSGVTGTRMVLVGSNAITLSQTTGANGNTVTIDAPATSSLSGVAPISVSTNGSTISILGPPSFSGGVSTLGNSSGDTGITGSRLVFVGGNNVTLSQSTNASGGTITVSGANIGGAQTGISGIANSQTTYTSGTVSLSELGAITIRSTTGQQFQLSVNSQTNQTEGWYALGNTTGQSSSTTMDARTISIRGDGIVSVGYSGGTLRISASQSVQPETQTAISGIANSQTTYTSGTVSLSELGAITIRSTTGNQFQLSVNAQSVQPETQTFVGWPSRLEHHLYVGHRDDHGGRRRDHGQLQHRAEDRPLRCRPSSADQPGRLAVRGRQHDLYQLGHLRRPHPFASRRRDDLHRGDQQRLPDQRHPVQPGWLGLRCRQHDVVVVGDI